MAEVNTIEVIDAGSVTREVGTLSRISKAEDAAHTTGDFGVMGLGVRKDTATALAGTDGDYIPLIVDANGRLHVSLSAITTSNALPVQLRDSGGTELTALATVSHDSADSGDPLKIGAKAIAALSGATLVAAADRTNAYADLDGVLIVRDSFALGDIVTGRAAITDGSSTSVIAAAGAGVKIYVTDIEIANSSASNVTVDIRDGTAGSVLATLSAPANGGNNRSFRTPIAFTANTAVAADPSAAASTVTVTITGFKSKI